MSEIVDEKTITPEDMVISDDPERPSGGFSVNSIMMKGDSSSNVFDNLVVPNWVWLLPTNNQTEEKTIGGRAKYHNEKENEDIIDDDLYNTLLELATENMKSNKKTNKKKKATTKKRKRKHENENKTKTKNNQTKKKK